VSSLGFTKEILFGKLKMLKTKCFQNIKETKVKNPAPPPPPPQKKIKIKMKTPIGG
jgi:hypothetical protein